MLYMAGGLLQGSTTSSNQIRCIRIPIRKKRNKLPTTWRFRFNFGLSIVAQSLTVSISRNSFRYHSSFSFPFIRTNSCSTPKNDCHHHLCPTAFKHHSCVRYVTDTESKSWKLGLECSEFCGKAASPDPILLKSRLQGFGPWGR